ncbi:unnamed protein product [Lota lota]
MPGRRWMDHRVSCGPEDNPRRHHHVRENDLREQKGERFQCEGWLSVSLGCTVSRTLGPAKQQHVFPPAPACDAGPLFRVHCIPSRRARTENRAKKQERRQQTMLLLSETDMSTASWTEVLGDKAYHRWGAPVAAMRKASRFNLWAANTTAGSPMDRMKPSASERMPAGDSGHY